MAIQQNSTLIYDNLDECPTLLNLPEELKRYSPILPPKTQINQNDRHDMQQQVNNMDSNNNNDRNHKNNNDKCARTASNNDIRKLREYRKKYAHQRAHQRQQEQQQRAASSCGAQSRRSRSISLHGINSTVEQGNKEIPIWVGDEPRYVSGVTSRTTCNDIIKALIDDEIRNGNLIYCGSRSKSGAASRDCSDYVITESWRGIERSYDGNMAILPVWKAWSRVHNELRLSLKHYKDVQDPIKIMAPSMPHKWYYPLRKFLTKLFKFNKHHNNNKHSKQPTTIQNKNCLLSPQHETPDEILFVILPDNMYNNDAEPAPHKVHETPHWNSVSKNSKTAMLSERLCRLSEARSSTRKRQRSRTRSGRKDGKTVEKRRISPSTNNCIQRRRNAAACRSLRQQLAQKTTAIDALYEREYALTKELSSKCKLYKLQNELYTNYDKHLEMSVGQVQRNVEAYAEQIIKTEHELLELKNEIRQDISIVNKLKRLTLAEADGVQDERMARELLVHQPTEQMPAMGDVETRTRKQPKEQMQFVDNIYEFCDNNASMLV